MRFFLISSAFLCTTNAFTFQKPHLHQPSSNLDAQDTRRNFVEKLLIATTPAATAFLSTTATIEPAFAASLQDQLMSDLTTSKSKLEGVPDLLQQGEWDKVRTILKTPPLNQLWNLSDSKNTLVQLAKETGEFELLELKDELAITLQMCDQLTYDNAFVYFQPGKYSKNM